MRFFRLYCIVPTYARLFVHYINPNRNNLAIRFLNINISSIYAEGNAVYVTDTYKFLGAFCGPFCQIYFDIYPTEQII